MRARDQIQDKGKGKGTMTETLEFVLLLLGVIGFYIVAAAIDALYRWRIERKMRRDIKVEIN